MLQVLYLREHAYKRKREREKNRQVRSFTPHRAELYTSAKKAKRYRGTTTTTTRDAEESNIAVELLACSGQRREANMRWHALVLLLFTSVVIVTEALVESKGKKKNFFFRVYLLFFFKENLCRKIRK